MTNDVFMIAANGTAIPSYKDMGKIYFVLAVKRKRGHADFIDMYDKIDHDFPLGLPFGVLTNLKAKELVLREAGKEKNCQLEIRQLALKQ